MQSTLFLYRCGLRTAPLLSNQQRVALRKSYTRMNRYRCVVSRQPIAKVASLTRVVRCLPCVPSTPPHLAQKW